MSEDTYRQIELRGSSKTSMEDAVQNAIFKASKTLHDLHWFQARGHRVEVILSAAYLPIA